MQHYYNPKVIKKENQKTRSWPERIALITAICVLLVMVWNSFQTRQSIKLTRDSVNKLDTAFALTREANKLMSGQLDVMRDEYNLSKSSFEVQKDQSVAVVKDLIEKGRPNVIISFTKVDTLGSGLIAYVDFTNVGGADAVDVKDSVTIKKVRIPKDSLVGSSEYPEISKNRPVNVSFPIPSYRGDFLIRIKLKYKWAAYGFPYESEKFYRYFFNNEIKAYQIRLMDNNEVKDRW